MRKLLLPLIVLISCAGGQEENQIVESEEQSYTDSSELVIDQPLTYSVDSLFREIDTNFNSMDLELPEGFEYQILFTEKRDMVTRADGQKFPAKGKHDLAVFIPINDSNEHGWLYVGHEDRYVNADLGDGGGGTVFEVKVVDGKWTVISDFHHVDFRPIRDTHRNCGGTITPWGTILSAEETYPLSNKNISYGGKYISNLDPVNGRDAYTNFGYMVEIDPVTRQPIQKLYSMGRFMHEDAQCMDDGKTVYLTDDFPSAYFYRFVADEMGDYSKGQLSVYKQSEDGESGSWIDIPRDTSALIECRKYALQGGATLFQRHEWLTEVNGKLYIAETGNAQYDWTSKVDEGAVPSRHYADHFHVGNNVYSDVHGRILEFDPATNKMRSYLEGGVDPNDPTKIMSNPDCIESVEINGTNFLVICEDIDATDLNRLPVHVEAAGRIVNEVYFLDMNTENPTVSDLRRFAIGPKGCETTGAYFTPDGKTMFLNIQHPYVQNEAPFNRSCTVAITGF